MRRWLLFLLAPLPALAITPEAKEWLAVSAQLEPVQCEKRQLRRKMAMAEAENRTGDLTQLRARVAELNRDKATAQLEQRLALLESRILDAGGRPRNPEDLDAISLQQRQAFYRCD